MSPVTTANGTAWKRIPDGVRVRRQNEQVEGVIDGLTEIVEGPLRNPDGLTQYRIDIGHASRILAAEEELCIVVDEDALVTMSKQPVDYRRFVTDCLHETVPAERFVTRSKARVAAPVDESRTNPSTRGGQRTE